jgi:AcrR family transcriptional regulator
MGYKHDKSDIVAAAVATVVEDGLSQLSFGRVAKRLGISDRMVVYYVPTKDELIGEVLAALGEELQQLLEKAFGADRMPVEELGRRAWPLLCTRNADRAFSAFFELSGLASARIEPYQTFAPMLIGRWIEWIAPHIEGATPAIRRRRALGLIAQLDGLLLIRRLCGSREASTAAAQLGFANAK